MKQLSKKGVVYPKEQAEAITHDQKDAMWQNGVLGSDRPEQLVNT